MSELVRFHCSACGKRLKAAIEQAGRRARCSCGAEIVVPVAATELVAARATESVCENRLAADPPTVTTLRPPPGQVSANSGSLNHSPASRSVVNGAPEHSFELCYRGDFRQVWQSILEYVHKLPDLMVLQSTEAPLQLIYQSKHFRQIIVVNVSPASRAGETDVAIHLFADTTQGQSAENKNLATRLFAYAGLKTQALDAKFCQTKGVGGPSEARASGLWKLFGGAGICLAGLILTALTNGQVLFYGAIIWGGVLFITGVVQVVVGRKVD
jgi:hypothetical protein